MVFLRTIYYFDPDFESRFHTCFVVSLRRVYSSIIMASDDKELNGVQIWFYLTYTSCSVADLECIQLSWDTYWMKEVGGRGEWHYKRCKKISKGSTCSFGLNGPQIVLIRLFIDHHKLYNFLNKMSFWPLPPVYNQRAKI